MHIPCFQMHRTSFGRIYGLKNQILIQPPSFKKAAERASLYPLRKAGLALSTVEHSGKGILFKSGDDNKIRSHYSRTEHSPFDRPR